MEDGLTIEPSEKGRRRRFTVEQKLARRQRRKCLGIIFSSGPELFEVELTSKGKPGCAQAPRRR